MRALSDEIPSFKNTAILRRRPLLSQAVGIGLAAGGARYYLNHPRRVIAKLPPELVNSGRDVFLTAEDGARLHGVWLSRDTTHKRTVVHYHGFNSSGGMVLARSPRPLLAWPLVVRALSRGYGVLLVDVRGHGRSEGPWDATGARAAADLISWVCWLRETQGQEWVGLWGNSFGATVGLALATQSPCGGLDAMVLDSPVISTNGLYSGLIRKPAYWLVQSALRRMDNEAVLEMLRTTGVSVPVLLIHGLEDSQVPSWHSQQVYRLIWKPDQPDRVTLWLVPGADHLESLEIVPEFYIQQTLSWFDRWSGGSP
jgi:pimeloyl-ACP methyl ester carboxylesterase